MSAASPSIPGGGDAYIAGVTNNSVNGFPATNAFQPALGAGLSDAFLMEISTTGQAAADRVYATLLGGSSIDAANAVALDLAIPPNAYVVGTTQSTNFPMSVTTPGYQTALHAGAANAFLSVIGENSNGVATLIYSTYLGGSSNDSAQGVAVVSPSGNGPPAIYVAGVTNSWDFPWRDNLQPFNGAQDAFVAKFNTTVPGAASLIYATPLGGTLPSGLAISSANAIAAETSAAGNHAFVAGRTSASDFPTAVTTAGNPVDGVQAFCSSCQVSPPATSNSPDAFVAEIDESAVARSGVRFNVAAVAFSAVPPGTSITSQPLAVLNTGEAPLNISSLQIAGSQDFQVLTESPACQAPINPGQVPGCSFNVAFVPSAAGAEHALLSVTDDAPGSPQILELSGTGQGPVALVSPLSIAFGNQPQSTSSPPQTISVTNAGDDNLTIATVTPVGADAPQFPVQTDTCATNVPVSPAASCTITASFSPQGTGPFQAAINITDNSAGGSTLQTVTLTGTGTPAAPAAAFVPPSMALAFGSITTQAASVPQDVILANKGSAPLDISSIAITGTNQADFAIAAPLSGSPCPASGGVLPFAQPPASCAVGVQFAPRLPAPKPRASSSWTMSRAARNK